MSSSAHCPDPAEGGKRTPRALALCVLATCLFAALFGSVVVAQEVGSPQRFSISQVRQLNATPASVRAYLDVEDAAGRPVTVLPDARLSATIGSAATSVGAPRAFADTEEGVGIIFLVDVSRSLRPEQFSEIKDAIDAWLGRMDSNGHAALLSFGSSSQVLVDWTDDLESVREALAPMQPTDDLTFLHQALADGLELGARKDAELPGRRAIIVLSDGRDEGSGLALEDILASVRSNPTPIYTIGFVPANRANRERDLDVLRRLAVNSGGSFHEATAGGLSEAYVQIEASIQSVWVTDIVCRDCEADGRDYRLQVELEAGGRVLSSGTQARLLPVVVSGRATNQPAEAATEPATGPAAGPIQPQPQSQSQPSAPPRRVAEPEADSVTGWLFSPRTLLFFWLPLLLGISLLAAALVQSRSERKRREQDKSSTSPVESFVRTDRALGADELYEKKEDEPEANVRPQTEAKAGSSSFSLSLPQNQVAEVDNPTSQFPVADLSSKAEALPQLGELEDDPSPLPSLRPDPSDDAMKPEEGADLFGEPAMPPPEALSQAPIGGKQSIGTDLSGQSHRAHYTLAPRVVRFMVLRGDNKGKQFRALLRDRLVVGSRSTADLVMVGENNVGSEQFELVQEGNDILIRNLDSARPTLVNGHELEERQTLVAGDLVGNGDVILRTILGDG